MTHGVGNEPRNSLKEDHRGWFVGGIPSFPAEYYNIPTSDKKPPQLPSLQGESETHEFQGSPIAQNGHRTYMEP